MSCSTPPFAAFASLDATGRIVAWSPAAEALLGWTRRQILLRDAADVLVAQEDIPAFDALLGRMRNGEAPSGRLCVTLRNRDGSRRVADLTTATIEVAGQPHLVVWLVPRDAPAEDEPRATAVVGHDGTYLAVDDATAQLLRRDADRLRGGDARRYVHPADLAPVLGAARRVQTGATRAATLDARLLLPGGGIVWSRLTLAVAADTDGAGLVVRAEDVTQLHGALGRLAEAARTGGLADAVDAVTGLLAPIPFGRALAARLRENGPAALLVLDLDLPGLDPRRRRAELDLLVSRVAGPFAALWRAGEPTGRVEATRLAATYALDDPLHADALAAHVEDVARGVDPRASARAIVVWPEGEEDAGDLLARATAGLDAGADMAPPRPELTRRIDEVLAYAREQLGVEAAFLARVDADAARLVAVSGPAERFGLDAGRVLPLTEITAGPLLAGRIVDAAAAPFAAGLAPTAAPVRTFVDVPVYLADGRVYGSLAVLDGSRRARHLDARSVEALRFLATMLGRLLTA